MCFKKILYVKKLPRRAFDIALPTRRGEAVFIFVRLPSALLSRAGDFSARDIRWTKYSSTHSDRLTFKLSNSGKPLNTCFVRQTPVLQNPKTIVVVIVPRAPQQRTLFSYLHCSKGSLFLLFLDLKKNFVPTSSGNVKRKKSKNKE